MIASVSDTAQCFSLFNPSYFVKYPTCVCLCDTTFILLVSTVLHYSALQTAHCTTRLGLQQYTPS